MSETEPKVDVVAVPETEVAPEVNPEVNADASAKKVKAKKEKKVKAPAPVPGRVPVPVTGINDALFGDLPLVSVKTDRVFSEITDVTADKAGEKVWIRARVNTVRGKGKTAFIQIRNGFYTAQLVMCAFGNEGEPPIELVKFAAKITAESVIDVYGTIVKPDVAIESCSQKDAEIHVEKIFVVNASTGVLPFQLADANRYDPLDNGLDNEENTDPNEVVKAEDGAIRVLQQPRLDNRWIDVRTAANHAIFRIQSRVGQYFREFLIDRDFVEIHTPKIIPGVSEGGANVFKIDYFGRECCLAQSPQLYKQMSIQSDLLRVFEVGSVFRAENSNTHRHLCEFIGLDLEMAYKDHYHEVLQIIGDMFVYIFDKLNENCQAELAAVQAQYPFTPLKYKKEHVIIPFEEAHKMMVEAGCVRELYEDPSTPHEKLLGKLMKEKYDVDFYIVDQYPSAIRPFYTMPNMTVVKEGVDPNDDTVPTTIKYPWANAFDCFIRGEEVTSGAARVHDVNLLTSRAAECGIPLEGLSSYIKSFEYGAFPHAGCGLGLERIVQFFLGLNNIRKSSLFSRTPARFSP